MIVIDAPHAKLRESIPKADFQTVWLIWPRYSSGQVQRQIFTDITRYSKYIISILHWLDEKKYNFALPESERKWISESFRGACSRQPLELKKVEQAGAAAIGRGDVNHAHIAIEQVRNIQNVIQSIYHLQNQWKQLIPEAGTVTPPPQRQNSPKMLLAAHSAGFGRNGRERPHQACSGPGGSNHDQYLE